MVQESAQDDIEETAGVAPGEILKYRDSLGFLVREAHRQFTHFMSGILAEESLTVPQWWFLRVLWETDKITQRELSEKLGMAEQTTVSALKILERRGFIARERDDADRRKLIVCLTEAGWRIRDEYIEKAVDANQLAFGGMSAAERAELRKLLLRVISNIRAHPSAD